MSSSAGASSVRKVGETTFISFGGVDVLEFAPEGTYQLNSNKIRLTKDQLIEQVAEHLPNRIQEVLKKHLGESMNDWLIIDRTKGEITRRWKYPVTVEVITEGVELSYQTPKNWGPSCGYESYRFVHRKETTRSHSALDDFAISKHWRNSTMNQVVAVQLEAKLSVPMQSSYSNELKALSKCREEYNSLIKEILDGFVEAEAISECDKDLAKFVLEFLDE